MKNDYDENAMMKSKMNLDKHRGDTPYFFNLHPHEQNFLELVVFGGFDMLVAYNDAYSEVDGFVKGSRRKVLNLLNTKAVRHAYDELTIIKQKTVINKIGQYVTKAVENIVDMGDFSFDEKIKLDANKFVVQTFIKSAKELKEAMKAPELNINVAQGGSVSIVQVISSTKEEEQKVFDGKEVVDVYEEIVNNEVEEVVVIKDK